MGVGLVGLGKADGRVVQEGTGVRGVVEFVAGLFHVVLTQKLDYALVVREVLYTARVLALAHEHASLLFILNMNADILFHDIIHHGRRLFNFITLILFFSRIISGLTRRLIKRTILLKTRKPLPHILTSPRILLRNRFDKISISLVILSSLRFNGILWSSKY